MECDEVFCIQQTRRQQDTLYQTMVQRDPSRHWVALVDEPDLKDPQWPQEARGHCFWDGEPFQGVPILCPTGGQNRGRITLDRTKEFCTFSCARAYLMDSKKMNMIDSLVLLAKKYFGIQQRINRAPPREALTKYGGYMDIDTFRAKSATHECILSTPPMLFIPSKVEERITDPTALAESKRTTEKDSWFLQGIGTIPNFDNLKPHPVKKKNQAAITADPSDLDQTFNKKVKMARKSVKTQKKVQKPSGRGTLEYSIGLVTKKRKLH